MTYNESPGRETPNFWINYYKILPCMCCMYTTYTLKTIVIHLLLMWNRNLCGEHNYTNCVVIKKSSKKSIWFPTQNTNIWRLSTWLYCRYIGFFLIWLFDIVGIQIWKHSIPLKNVETHLHFILLFLKPIPMQRLKWRCFPFLGHYTPRTFRPRSK